MKKPASRTLSIVPTTSKRTTRTSQQTITVLTFIHRFHHVTSRHVQLKLGHASIVTTNKQLSLMRAKGLIARDYEPEDRGTNRPASYYLTKEGLNVLKAAYPTRSYRNPRSLRNDASASRRRQAYFHTLAEVYAHCKRHHDGFFELSAADDIRGLDYIPEEVPDGYLTVTGTDGSVQRYFIEVYGWARSTDLQRRRLHSYVQFAESEIWQQLTGEPVPRLFLVTASESTRRRLAAQYKLVLRESMLTDFHVYTANVSQLDGEQVAIWREVQYN